MRFVVKIGSQLLTNQDNSLNTEFIAHIAEQIATLHKQGHEPLIVTSGAVAAGRQTIKLKKETKTIPYRQALAAVGQTFLLDTYRDSFSKYDITIGQVLLTMYDLEAHEHFLSTHNTIDLLLQLGVIPVINENDVTTFNEGKFGNNDKLSAHVASLMNAEMLIMLTDVEGLYNANPKEDPDAKLLETIEKITPAMHAGAGSGGTSKGVGGMSEKLKAAEYAMDAGVDVWITSGCTKNVVTDLVAGKAHHGSHFKTQTTSKGARRRWLQTQLVKSATLVVDEGCMRAVCEKGKSLLPSGITAVEGRFKRGDVVSIQGPNGEKIGFGQVKYDSKAIQALQGKQSDQIEPTLGYHFGDEVMNRDDMVVG
jgi:glutamate 5-kinase